MHTEDQDFPTVGDRLKLQHQDNNQLSIQTEIVEFKHLELAIVRAEVKTSKGLFTGSGVASKDKDPDYIHSLLEVAETRAVSRALRFSGACVERTGREEIPKQSKSAPNIPLSSGNISNGQKKAIERMAKEHGWNIIEAIKRILGTNIEVLEDLDKRQASVVIQRMRAVIKAA